MQNAQADGIESSNIVGYQQVNVDKGWSFKTIIFKNVENTDFDLTTLQVIKNNGSEYGSSGLSSLKANGFTIQKLSTGGAYLDKYHYITCVSGSGAVAQKGWYKNGTEYVASGVTIRNGEGIIINTAKTDAAILMNGEVDLVCQTIIPKGWSFSGNSTLATFKLSEITVKKNNGVDYGSSGLSSLKANGFTIQKMNTSGAYLDKYHYITCVSGSGAVAEKGWYKDGTTLVTEETDLTFAPGDGFIVNTAKSDAMIEMPKIITQ